MRTVLIGSDFVYDKDGNLVPIEINTAVGFNRLALEDIETALDFSELFQFISDNNFTTVHYIGDIVPVDKKLKEQYSGSTVSYQFHNVSKESVTIPYIEDGSDILIIRSAYDTTALVDDTYCRDKINFLNLISGQTYGSQYVYKDSLGNVINNVTIINDNGNHPNFIRKHRYPNYDKKILPRFYKVSSLEELNTIVQSLPSDEFLMEFHMNTSKLYQGHLQVFRGLNILYPPSLQNISIGGLTYFTDYLLTDTQFSTDTFELLNYGDRLKYIYDSGYNFKSPKLSVDDLVEMSDGTYKTAQDLQIGDLVKTINIPNPNDQNINSPFVNYQITYDELVTGTTYASNVVTNKIRVAKYSFITKLTFTDGVEWFDTDGSSYLGLRNNQVRFLLLKNPSDPTAVADLIVKVGDTIVLLDTSSETINFTPKVVQSIEYLKDFLDGWIIEVENQGIFLTKENSQTQTSFLSLVSIEHNLQVCSGTFMCFFHPDCNKGGQCCSAFNTCISSCSFCPV